MASNSLYEQQIERLRVVILRRWWKLAIVLWLTLGTASLWSLRHEFTHLQQYFTWTAVRYALAYNRPAALGLGLCSGLTTAVLISQSRHILFGLSTGERQRLDQTLQRIRQQGPSHPLWCQVIETS